MDHAFPKTRFHAQNTKNINCPATIILRDIAFFTGFKVINIMINIMMPLISSKSPTVTENNFFTATNLKGSTCSFSSTVLTTIYRFHIFQNYIPKSFFSGVSTDEFIILTTQISRMENEEVYRKIWRELFLPISKVTTHLLHYYILSALPPLLGKCLDSPKQAL